MQSCEIEHARTIVLFSSDIDELRIHIMAKVKFYAVAVGRKPGVYNTWSECQEQVSFSCQCIFATLYLSYHAL